MERQLTRRELAGMKSNVWKIKRSMRMAAHEAEKNERKQYRLTRARVGETLRYLSTVRQAYRLANLPTPEKLPTVDSDQELQPRVQLLERLIRDAGKGVHIARLRLQTIIRLVPALWRRTVEDSQRLVSLLIEATAGGSPDELEELRQQVEYWQSDYGYEQANPLMRLAIMAVILSESFEQFVASLAAKPRSNKRDEKYWRNRVRQAQRDYFRAWRDYSKELKESARS